MALVVGWLEIPALDQLISSDTVLFPTCSGSSESGFICEGRHLCQRRHRAFRLAPMSTGRSSQPGSRVSSVRLSFVKHEVMPAEDF